MAEIAAKGHEIKHYTASLNSFFKKMKNCRLI